MAKRIKSKAKRKKKKGGIVAKRATSVKKLSFGDEESDGDLELGGSVYETMLKKRKGTEELEVKEVKKEPKIKKKKRDSFRNVNGNLPRDLRQFEKMCETVSEIKENLTPELKKKIQKELLDRLYEESLKETRILRKGKTIKQQKHEKDLQKSRLYHRNRAYENLKLSGVMRTRKETKLREEEILQKWKGFRSTLRKTKKEKPSVPVKEEPKEEEEEVNEATGIADATWGYDTDEVEKFDAAELMTHELKLKHRPQDYDANQIDQLEYTVKEGW